MKLTTEQKEANKAARIAARQQAKEAARIEKEKKPKAGQGNSYFY